MLWPDLFLASFNEISWEKRCISIDYNVGPCDPCNLDPVLKEPRLYTYCGIYCSPWSCDHLSDAFDVVTCWVGHWEPVIYVTLYATFPVNEVRNMRRGGLLVFAPPCSSWVFLLLDFFSVSLYRFENKSQKWKSRTYNSPSPSSCLRSILGVV